MMAFKGSCLTYGKASGPCRVYSDCKHGSDTKHSGSLKESHGHHWATQATARLKKEGEIH